MGPLAPFIAGLGRVLMPTILRTAGGAGNFAGRDLAIELLQKGPGLLLREGGEELLQKAVEALLKKGGGELLEKALGSLGKEFGKELVDRVKTLIELGGIGALRAQNGLLGKLATALVGAAGNMVF
jgi:hypothetical protein